MNESYFAERGIAYRSNEHQAGRPTLLLLHGLSGSISAWYPYEETLSKNFNLIIPDLRGHGHSKRWEQQQDYVFSQHVTDITTLLAHRTTAPVTIVAHSFAAVVARELIREGNANVQGVVLLAPAYGVRRLFLTKLFTPLLAVLAKLIYILPVRGSERVEYSRFVGCADWDLLRIWADVGSTGLHSYLWSLLQLYQYPDTPWHELSSLRTLVLHGRDDRFVPFAHSMDLVCALRNAKLELLPNANHMLVINDVSLITEKISAFAHGVT